MSASRREVRMGARLHAKVIFDLPQYGRTSGRDLGYYFGKGVQQRRRCCHQHKTSILAMAAEVRNHDKSMNGDMQMRNPMLTTPNHSGRPSLSEEYPKPKNMLIISGHTRTPLLTTCGLIWISMSTKKGQYWFLV